MVRGDKTQDSQYRKTFIIQMKVFQWVKSFQVAEQALLLKTTQAVSLQMVNSVEQVNALVQVDRWITVTDIADMLDINCGFTYSIIHKDLGC